MTTKKILISIYCFAALHASDEPTRKKPKTETTQAVAITLYHTLNSPNEFTSVKEKGLLSFAQAYEQGLTKSPLNMVLKVKLDHRKDKVIYFQPTSSECAQIAYKVPFENSWVYNAAYRKIGDWPAYNNSKMTLSAYLQALDAMKKVQEEHPNKNVKLHHNSCTPIICALKNNSSSTKRPRFESHKVTEYEAEVAVFADRIAPENLIFLE